MRKSFASLMAIGLALAFAVPVLGSALTFNAAAGAGPGKLDVTLLAPLAGKTQWYGGAAIPVKVTVVDPDGEGFDANVTLWVNGEPATARGGLNMDNSFKFMGENIYQYNLDTRPYPAGPGSAPIVIKVLATEVEDHEGMVEVSIHLN